MKEADKLFVINCLSHGVIKIWHLSILYAGNCEAPFRVGCQPLFVLTGCLLLNCSSLLREGHPSTLVLEPFIVLTGILLLLFSENRLQILILHGISMPNSRISASFHCRIDHIKNCLISYANSYGGGNILQAVTHEKYPSSAAEKSYGQWKGSDKKCHFSCPAARSYGQRVS